MREILFRGKSLKDNEWTEGYYCRYGWTGKEKDYIIPDYASALWGVEVDSNTIGQYTGQYDANKKKIYEGDIIQYDGDYDGIDGFTRSISEKAIVLWDEDYCGFVCKVIGDESGDSYSWLEYRENPDLTIIGNIYDNPELIGGEKQ